MVYLIKTEDGKFAKIGFTSDSVALRIQALQTSSPLLLVCEEVVDGGKTLEKYLHFKCKDHCKNREWFHYNDEFKSIWDKEKFTSEETAGQLLNELKGSVMKVDESGYYRVDIKLSRDVLSWAALEAAKMDISRRRFLAICAEWEFARQRGTLDTSAD